MYTGLVTLLRRTATVAARFAPRIANTQRDTASLIRVEVELPSAKGKLLGQTHRWHSTTTVQDSVAGVSGKETALDSGARSESPGGSADAKGSTWAGRVLGLFPMKTSRALSSARLLQACLNNVERKVWYTDGMISTELLGKHLWLSTNVWMVSRRLLREGEEGKRVQEVLFDELWRETMRQMRSIKVSDMMLRKYLKDAQQHTFNALVQFDHAYTLGTPEERLDALAGALWRSVFMRNENLREGHMRLMAEYVDSELADMYEIDKNAFFQACLEFASPPAGLGADDKLASHAYRGSTNVPRGKGAVNSHKVLESDASDSSIVPDGDLGVDGKGRWRASLAESGKVYFWHTVTKQTTFDQPEGFEDWVPCTMPETVAA